MFNHDSKNHRDIQKTFSISDMDRKVFSESGNASTYGTLKESGIEKIIELLKKYYNERNLHFDKSKLSFIDLGSGDGRLPILFVDKYGFKDSCGIELSNARHRMGEENLNKCQNKNRVKLYNGNFLDDQYSFSPYDVIYISSLCFPENIVEQIKQKANRQCKNNCHIFSSKGFNMDNGNVDNIKFLEETTIPQSWIDSSKLNCYRVNKPDTSLHTEDDTLMISTKNKGKTKKK